MTALSFNLLVLHCMDLEKSRIFYEALLGLPLKREQHGTGPVHYSVQVDELLLELYPSSLVCTTRLGFTVDNVFETVKHLPSGHVLQHEFGSAVVVDPDGNKIELR